MKYYIYKYNFFISFVFGLSIVFLIDFSFNVYLPLSFSLVIFILNFLSMNLSIYYFLSKFIEIKDVFESSIMNLSSTILIKEKNNIKISKFSLINKKYNICLEVETKNGIKNFEYQELNIDNIMIKKDKSYNILLKKEIGLINGREISKMVIPLKIDYFFLDDKFHIYRVKTL